MKKSDKIIADRHLTEYISLWKLTPDGDQFYTHCSLLQPVKYNSADAMLKIPMEAEEKKGSLMMAWWDGYGAAKVFKHDDNALLMERISGDHISLLVMVKQGNDSEATRIICSVAKKLHAPTEQQPDFELITLEEWFKDLWPAAVKYGGIIKECAGIARRLLDSQSDIAVLHGDLHHENVLYSNDHGWVVIDPKRLIGERAFDYANIFCNPNIETALATGRFEQQLQVISKEANLDPMHLLKWTIAWCGLSAAWILDEPHEGETPDTDLGVAQIALDILKKENNKGA